MSRVLEALARHAAGCPEHIALQARDVADSLSYGRLAAAVETLAGELRSLGSGPVALLADNTPAWAVADLAALAAGRTMIPVPHFFSPAQIRHLLQNSGAGLLLSDHPEQGAALLAGIGIETGRPLQVPAGTQDLAAFVFEGTPSSLPEDCARITYTSGSTGEPKGVCLSLRAMEVVAASLTGATDAQGEDRHLAALPYATLLENIGGLYAPLLAGATVCATGLTEVGLSGASGLDIARFAAVLNERCITTCIMIPQMLHGLVAAIEGGMPKPSELRYIAVGGAPVSEHLMARASELGLPVYEGYGLSEAASVVAVNRPGDNLPGSVGRPLPHVEIDFGADGEILVRGSLFAGYLGKPPLQQDAWWPTGDIGWLDEAGFLHLAGRKKHLFITAFGRNVAPEWVERELAIESAIAQVCVFGEAKPFNVAVIVPRQGASEAMVDAAIVVANERLPDYAQVSRWLRADEPFSVGNGLLTGTGRPRRAQIYQAYRDRIEALYEEHI